VNVGVGVVNEPIAGWGVEKQVRLIGQRIVKICSLGGTPSPSVQGYGGMGSIKRFVGLEPKVGGSVPSGVGMKPC